jgi:hypothetical protein
LAGGGAFRRSPVAPLIAIGLDKAGLSGLPNLTIRFLQFRIGASGCCSFHVATHFGDFVGESTTSSTPSMKGGNSSHKGSDLNRGNILKPTFDTLMKEGRKAFEAYRKY